MSKKIKTAVFSVSFWGKDKHPYYNSWRSRVNKYIDYDNIFTCAGSYSDPKVMENDIEVVQIGIENTLPYNRDWNYFRVGFMTAMYHLLLNVKDFDIAIHVQDSVLLNLDLNPIIQEFHDRDEIISSPQFLSEGGILIETALMMLKKDAIKQYITSALRPSLTEYESINVEEEAFYMFKDKWWNFIPQITTIRKNDFIAFEDEHSLFSLDHELFLKSPIISTSKSYTTKKDVREWEEVNSL